MVTNCLRCGLQYVIRQLRQSRIMYRGLGKFGISTTSTSFDGYLRRKP
ncbi:hypothetical protein LINPERPRIM_LOCUS22020, partial [Linum perenne]